jgi:hypothetical protein
METVSGGRMTIDSRLKLDTVFSLGNRSVVILTAVLTVGALAVSASAWMVHYGSDGSTTATNSATKSPPSSPQGRAQSQRIDPVLITLLPTGFEPKEVMRPKGLFLLVVDNRSNNSDVLLRLDHESGRREYEERVKDGKIDWRKPFDLHPGRYSLTEANHPNWVCHITIAER